MVSKEQKPFIVDLKNVYQADTKELAEFHFLELEEKWGKRYPAVIKSWSNNWDNLTNYFKYTKDIRKIIYTTNPIGTPGQAWLSKRVKFPCGKGLAIQPKLSVAA